MNLSKTLELVRQKEKANGRLLESALLLKRYYSRSDFNMLRCAESFYLPVVNAKARIKWATAFIEQTFRYFGLDENDEGPGESVYLVTIADKSHVTSTQAKNINFRAIRRKLGGALQGLNYIGMTEAGYYNAIYDENAQIQKNIISWHGHFIVWGITRKELLRWKAKIAYRIAPIMPDMCAIHIKVIPPDQFGQWLWYINKSPRKEYSVGKRSEPNSETGSPHYKQNKRPLRPGHRVKLFHMLRDITLPELAMAGGEGREVMRKIKYEALKTYRERSLRK
jgi:hypothetical protein